MKASQRVQIPRKDLRRDVFRSGGPGGQNQNKVESGVRWTHKPTGISAESRTDKSQHANSEIAYERLCGRLLQAWLIQHRTRARRPPAAFGDWKRVYRLCGNVQRAVDIELGIDHPTRSVLNGEIDGFLRASLVKQFHERTGWVSDEE